MPGVGVPQPLSFRGDGPWRGVTTKSLSLPFHFAELENCYVTGDGSEIRMFPGFKTMLDPVTTARTPTQTPSEQAVLGYERTTVDAKRVVQAASGSYFVQTNPSETMQVWSRITHVHAFEQVRGRWQIIAETSDRREPISNVAQDDFIYVTEYVDNGTNITLTVDQAPRLATNQFNSLPLAANFPPSALFDGGDQITLSGLTGALATLLNNKRHTINATTPYPTGTTIRINTTSGGAVGAVTGQTGFIDRVSSTSSGAGAGTSGSTDVSDDEESLTVFTSLVAGDPDTSTPSQILYAAHVANRHRDFGDATGNIKEGNNNSGNLHGRSRRKQKPIPYRIVPHVAGNRLLMAAPGYSCAFQAPIVVPVNFDETNSPTDSFVGIGWTGNDIYDKVRCVGVPKCVQLEDPEKAVIANTWHVYSAGTDDFSFGGTGGLGREGTYQFKFAYKDDSTGEIGLCSEPISITTDAATHVQQGLQFIIYFPGYLMPESLALTINVYRTAKNGNTFFFDRSIPMAAFNNTATPLAESAKFGLTPNTAATTYHHQVIYKAVWQADATLTAQQGVVPDTIEQMPMGCKAARTVRGWTIYGGQLGNTGSRLELLAGNTSLVYDRVANGVNGEFYNFNELTSRGVGVTDTQVDGGYGCAGTGIPPAYSGQQVVSRVLFPYPRQIMRLNKLVNTLLGAGAATFDATEDDRLMDVRYQLLDTPLRPESDFSNTNRPTYLMMARGKLQISEADNPNITPATNTTVIANEWDEDIEGIGDAGGQIVACTRNKTYMLGFSATPIGVPAEVATDRFGCIAPNSMVSFDGGCAWLSDRGPCAMTGAGFDWIGEPLERHFIGVTSRYKRDSTGMMRHAWACHDAERGLLYFGVFANRFSGEASEVQVSYRGSVARDWDEWAAQSNGDEAQSRFPCDEILVYSYRVRSWSFWRPPAGVTVKWMTRGQDTDGHSRVFWMDESGRIYALDDTYQNFNRICPKTNVSTAGTYTAGTPIPTSGGFGQALADRGSPDTFAQVGLPVLIVRSDNSFVARSTITAINGNNLTLADTVTVEFGDFVQIGVRECLLRTNFVNLADSEASKLSKIGFRYQIDTPITGFSWMFTKARSITNKPIGSVDQDPEAKPVFLTADSTTQNHDVLGVNFGADPVVQDKGFARGSNKGQNHQIELSIIGGGALRIHDLYAEVS